MIGVGCGLVPLTTAYLAGAGMILLSSVTVAWCQSGKDRFAAAEAIPAAGQALQSDKPLPPSAESEEISIDTIAVEGRLERTISPTYIITKDRQPNTERTISRQGIGQFATPGQTNPLMAINMLPSVNVQFAEPYGLGAQFTVNIRGKSAFQLAQTIEDLPVNGAVGGFQLFDLENIKDVTLYSGAIPVDHGFAPSNATGQLNLSILRPQDRFGLTYRQSNGSFSFNRTYGRIDSGMLPSRTKFFLSYSYSDSHKWKGEGDAPAGRSNGEFGIVQEFGRYAKLEIFGAIQSYRTNTFRALTFAQSQNLSTFRGFDFNRSLTGNPAQNAFFYGVNSEQFNNWAIFANLEVKPTVGTRFMLKPYYWSNDGFTLTGGTVLGAPGVTRWDQNNRNYGLVAQYDVDFWGMTGTVGYWHDTMQAPPPPVDMKAFTVLSDGMLQFRQWSLLSQQNQHVFHAPYVKIAKHTDRYDVQIGLKYLYQVRPSYQGYNLTGLPDVPYDQVFGANPTLNPNLVVQSNSYHQFLPYAGFSYSFTERLVGRFVYGRNYGRPFVGPAVNAFNASQAAFLSQGLTLNSIVSPLKQQLTDNFDVGFRYNERHWYIAPTLFDTEVHNQETFVFDPKVGTQYPVTTMESRSIGGEIEVGVEPIEKLSIFGTASYFRYYFLDNIKTATNSTLQTQGNQIPDAPKWMAKFGASYEIYGVTVAPLIRWIGSRFGDAANTQRVSDYYVIDINLAYKIPEKLGYERLGIKNLRLFGSVLNVTDQKYVSNIRFNELQFTGGTAYFAGAPFTAVVGLTASTF